MSIEDTTESTVPADADVEVPTAVLPTAPPTTGLRAIRTRWYVLGGVLLLFIASVIAANFLPATVVGVDTYVLAPGDATNTAPAITIRGTDSFPPDSEIAFTTVSIRRDVSVFDWLHAKWDDSHELVQPELIDGTRTTEETRQVTQFQMDQSQDTATVVALNYLGYELVPEVEGAFVILLVDGSPAAASLRLGDLITRVDDTDIRSSEDLATAIQAKPAGATVAVQLLRSPAEQGGSGADPAAIDVTTEIILAEHPQIEGAGFLGVQIETPIKADAPFDVEINVGRVRGPSAGLAFSLAILDVITEGELTGGIDVATTGTIDRAGNVGPVGAVPQKTEAAVDAGIELFLVPPAEYETAVNIAGNRMDVRCVQTFGDAVLALAEFGGNGIAVAEAAGVAPPEPSPSPVDEDDGFITCAEAVGS